MTKQAPWRAGAAASIEYGRSWTASDGTGRLVGRFASFEDADRALRLPDGSPVAEAVRAPRVVRPWRGAVLTGATVVAVLVLTGWLLAR